MVEVSGWTKVDKQQNAISIIQTSNLQICLMNKACIATTPLTGINCILQSSTSAFFVSSAISANLLRKLSIFTQLAISANPPNGCIAVVQTFIFCLVSNFRQSAQQLYTLQVCRSVMVLHITVSEKVQILQKTALRMILFIMCTLCLVSINQFLHIFFNMH